MEGSTPQTDLAHMSPPEKSRPAASGHEISAVSITHHRLPLAPVECQLGHPSTRSFRCHRRAGEHRQRSRRSRFGRPHARLRGSRGSFRRPRPARARTPLPRSVQYRLPLRPLLAARSGALESRRQDPRPAVLEASRGPREPRARLRLLRHAARRQGPGRRRRALPRRRLPGAKAAVSIATRGGGCPGTRNRRGPSRTH